MNSGLVSIRSDGVVLYSYLGNLMLDPSYLRCCLAREKMMSGAFNVIGTVSLERIPAKPVRNPDVRNA